MSQVPISSRELYKVRNSNGTVSIGQECTPFMIETYNTDKCHCWAASTEINIHGRSHEQASVPEQGPCVSAISRIFSVCRTVQHICLEQTHVVVSGNKNFK